WRRSPHDLARERAYACNGPRAQRRRVGDQPDERHTVDRNPAWERTGDRGARRAACALRETARAAAWHEGSSAPSRPRRRAGPVGGAEHLQALPERLRERVLLGRREVDAALAAQPRVRV